MGVKLIRKAKDIHSSDPKHEFNPNGMNLYSYRNKEVTAYNSKDVPNRFKFLYPNL